MPGYGSLTSDFLISPGTVTAQLSAVGGARKYDIVHAFIPYPSLISLPGEPGRPGNSW